MTLNGAGGVIAAMALPLSLEREEVISTNEMKGICPVSPL